MISVLIPVYQYDVVGLVQSLSQQLEANKIGYEILVYDDCSLPELKQCNVALSQIDNVCYVELSQNIGRSKIRNLLAEKARYDNLLFLDCDVSLPDSSFIERYLNFSAKYNVTVGGICYHSQKPADSVKVLRWKYGHSREALTAVKRNKQPYGAFKTANFFVTKAIFSRIKFSEEITGYGHEDTLFGYQLEQAGIPILHIDNPVCHEGLEAAPVFIKKSEQAVTNLYLLFLSGALNNSWKQIPLLRYFKVFKVLRLRYLTAILYLMVGAFIRKAMQGRYPLVFLLNVYKLLYISYISVFDSTDSK